MFGYATDETPELMPLPILLAHRLAQQLSQDRKTGRISWLRPDGKTQVSVAYSDGRPQTVETVLVSTQHLASIGQQDIRAYVCDDLLPRALGDWHAPHLRVLVNPTGSFVQGGPAVDCGLTGRKTIVDTYGGLARSGGGAFSGKDPTKVDRSAAYFSRYVARQVIQQRLARRVEIQVAYAIGEERPVSLHAETFGTGDSPSVQKFVQGFDFGVAAMLEQLSLRAPLYRGTTNYGHFGRPGFSWEQ
jgi:S-adenosylmethionine synthetase